MSQSRKHYHWKHDNKGTYGKRSPIHTDKCQGLRWLWMHACKRKTDTGHIPAYTALKKKFSQAHPNANLGLKNDFCWTVVIVKKLKKKEILQYVVKLSLCIPVLCLVLNVKLNLPRKGVASYFLARYSLLSDFPFDKNKSPLVRRLVRR